MDNEHILEFLTKECKQISWNDSFKTKNYRTNPFQKPSLGNSVSFN